MILTMCQTMETQTCQEGFQIHFVLQVEVMEVTPLYNTQDAGKTFNPHITF
jgi:hypothetical protein